MVHRQSQGPRILIVEEDEGHAYTIENQISRRLENPSVTVARHFDQALALTDSHCFDVAVVDFPASESHGLALVRSLHEADPDLAIVVVAENVTETLVRRLFNFGCEELLIKDSSFCRVVPQLIQGLYRRKQQQLRADLSVARRAATGLSMPARKRISRLSDEIDEPLGNILNMAKMILESPTSQEVELENRVKSIQKAARRIKDSLEAITGMSVPAPATSTRQAVGVGDGAVRPKSGR